ncbi:hypothetical protein B7494_g5743 [Chlorociboria aeruginascens]|nr:hypothetical protein B7494_g5743 [Chlorociboria aeruginascens]
MSGCHSPSLYLHTIQNSSLILLSLFLAPLCTFITIISLTISPYIALTKHISHLRRWRTSSSSTFRPRRILITGLSTSTGLTLARIFYRSGHIIVGGSFEPYYLPLPAHFSLCFKIFYRFSQPDEDGRKYVKDVIDAIKKEKVELWVHCGDGIIGVKESVERETQCKVVGFGEEVKGEFEGDVFAARVRGLGFEVCDLKEITSEAEALDVLYLEASSRAQGYVPKSSDPRSKDIGILPRAPRSKTETILKSLNPTPTNPQLLQEHIPSLQYTASTLLINSKITSFIVSPASTHHYTSLPHSSTLSLAILHLTTIYVSSMPIHLTGHLSLTISVPASLLSSASEFGATSSSIASLSRNIIVVCAKHSINDNIMLLQDEAEDLADSYLSILEDHEPRGISNGHRSESLVMPRPDVGGYYFAGVEIIRALIGVLRLLRWKVGLREMAAEWMCILEKIVYWREGTWENMSDPKRQDESRLATLEPIQTQYISSLFPNPNPSVSAVQNKALGSQSPSQFEILREVKRGWNLMDSKVM